MDEYSRPAHQAVASVGGQKRLLVLSLQEVGFHALYTALDLLS